MNRTILFLGLNTLDLIITGIALSLGGIEIGFYATIGLHSIWQITLAKIGLVAVLLLLVHKWEMKKFLKYGNIVLAIVCLWNLTAMLIWRTP